MIVSPGPKCRAYLLDVTRQRLLLPDLRRLIVAQAERFNANHVLIEDCGSGIGLLQGLKADGFWRAQAVKPAGGKLGRFMNATPFIEAGNLFVPPQAPWLPAWVDELSVFPNGAFDDQVDATSQAIKWVTDLPVGFGYLDYYKSEMGQ